MCKVITESTKTGEEGGNPSSLVIAARYKVKVLRLWDTTAMIRRNISKVVRALLSLGTYHGRDPSKDNYLLFAYLESEYGCWL
jgi:hypothetical protein